MKNLILAVAIIATVFQAQTARAHLSSILCQDDNFSFVPKTLQVLESEGFVNVSVESKSTLYLGKMEEDLGLLLPGQNGFENLSLVFSELDCKQDPSNKLLIICSGNVNANFSHVNSSDPNVQINGKGYFSTQREIKSTQSVGDTNTQDIIRVGVGITSNAKTGSSDFDFVTEKCQAPTLKGVEL